MFIVYYYYYYYYYYVCGHIPTTSSFGRVFFKI